VPPPGSGNLAPGSISPTVLAKVTRRAPGTVGSTCLRMPLSTSMRRQAIFGLDPGIGSAIEAEVSRSRTTGGWRLVTEVSPSAPPVGLEIAALCRYV
jgi:hypothetical protein